ncbi:MAG: porin PorA family protein [Thermoplasmatota archaeon]
MRGKRHILVVVGLVFFIVAPSFSFVLTPSMKRVPDDLHKTVVYEGDFGLFNTSTMQMDYIDVEIHRELTAMEERDGVLLIREDISIFNTRAGEPIPGLADTNIWAIDPYTSKNVRGYGDTERVGQYIFPIGVEKKQYVVWNSDMDDVYRQGYVDVEDATGTAHYRGEETVEGVTCYRFSGSQEEICIGPGVEGTPPGTRMFYEGEQSAWVHPETGVIVDYDKHIRQYLQFPDLNRLPGDLNTTARLSGTISMFNLSNAASDDPYDRWDARVEQHVWVDETSSDEMYMVGSETTARDAAGNLLPSDFQAYSVDGVDPDTMRYDPHFSDKSGRLTFPIGIGPRDYELWNSDIGAASTARYMGRDNLGGLPVYRYLVSVEDHPRGIMEIPGMSDRHIDLSYTGDTVYYVEPATGGIVNVEKTGTVTAMFPDLHTIPENIHSSLEMDGELWILGEGATDIRMVREVTATDFHYHEGRKVIIMEDNTTVYDTETGTVVDMASGSEVHGVYADTAEEAPDYGDMYRQGIFTFPPGVEKRTYQMWNTEISTTSPVRFLREEDHEGIHTYLYETEESRQVYDPTEGIEQEVQYTTTTRYWVEPHSGSVIDMEKVSEKKVNLFNYLVGIPGPIWVKAYELTLSFSDATVAKNVKSGRDAAAQLQLSGTAMPVTEVNLSTMHLMDSIASARQQKQQVQELDEAKVKAVDFHYWMSQESVEEMADDAQTTGFLLMLFQAIVPILLVIFGVALVVLWYVNRPE